MTESNNAHVDNSELKELIMLLRAEVETLARTIRGHNGEKGLATRIALIEQRCDYTSVAREASITHLNQAVEQVRLVAEGMKNGGTKDKPIFGTWEWFRDGFGAQILTVVVTVVVLKLVDVIVAHWNVIP